jgi:hypothetical protein
MTRCTFSSPLRLLLILSFSCVAGAQALSPATAYQYFDDTFSTAPQITSAFNIPLSSSPVVNHIAQNTASTTGGIDPTQTATVFVSGSPAGVFDTEDIFTYEFEALGPSGTVPVNFTSHGSASVSPATLTSLAAAASLVKLETLGLNPILIGCASSGSFFPLLGQSGTSFCAPNTSATSSSFNLDSTPILDTNTPYFVQMFTEAIVQTGASNASGFASAVTDPSITLATTDPRYSLVFSPGVGAGTVTPEPNTAILTLTATLFGLLAVPYRRRGACGNLV